MKKFLHHFSGRFTHCYAIAHNNLCIDEEPTPLVTFKHGEADTLLIWYSIYCKLRFGDNIYIDIICSDTDVLLLLLNFALQLPYNTIFCSLSYSITIGILYKALERKVCKGLLSLHALTGCDRTGRFSGKVCTWFHKFCAWYFLCAYEILRRRERVVRGDDRKHFHLHILCLYRKKRCRYRLLDGFSLHELKEGEQLPPTKSTFTQHLLRALFHTWVEKCIQNDNWKIEPCVFWLVSRVRFILPCADDKWCYTI